MFAFAFAFTSVLVTAHSGNFAVRIYTKGLSDFAHARTQILSRELRPQIGLLLSDFYSNLATNPDVLQWQLSYLESRLSAECHNIYITVSMQYLWGWHTREKDKNTWVCKKLDQPFFPVVSCTHSCSIMHSWCKAAEIQMAKGFFSWQRWLSVYTCRKNIISATNITAV